MKYFVAEVDPTHYSGYVYPQKSPPRIHSFKSLQEALEFTQIEVWKGKGWEGFILLEFIHSQDKLEAVLRRPGGKVAPLTFVFSSLHNYHFWVTPNYPYPLVLAESDTTPKGCPLSKDEPIGWTNWQTLEVWDAACGQLGVSRDKTRREVAIASQFPALFSREELVSLLSKDRLTLKEYAMLLRVPQLTEDREEERLQCVTRLRNLGKLRHQAVSLLCPPALPIQTRTLPAEASPAPPLRDVAITCPKPPDTFPKKPLFAEPTGIEPEFLKEYTRNANRYILTSEETTFESVADSSWWDEIRPEVRARFPRVDWTWSKGMGRALGLLPGSWVLHLWYVGSTGREPLPWRARLAKDTPNGPYKKKRLPLRVGGTWEDVARYVLEDLEAAAEAHAICGEALYHD